MNLESQAVFEAALALSDQDRALLVERLLETLSPEEFELSEDELVAELDRRRAEMDCGADTGISWSELKQET